MLKMIVAFLLFELLVLVVGAIIWRDTLKNVLSQRHVSTDKQRFYMAGKIVGIFTVITVVAFALLSFVVIVF